MKPIYYVLISMIFLCGCRKSQEDNTSEDMSLYGDTILLGKSSTILSKMKTLKVTSEPYKMEFTTSGVVKAIPTNYAEVASPFAGRITKSFVRLGQKVSKGSPVFAISSPAFYETGKECSQAREEMELAKKSLQRVKDLVQNKVGAQKDLEEAEVNYELKKKDYENAVASLKVFQVDSKNIAPGQPMIVRSPISGEVVTDKIVMGQYMKEDAEPVAVIANLDQVWVVAHVKEKDLSLVHPQDEVEIQLVALPDQSIKGTVFHISEMLDEETRSVEVIIACDNRSRMMKPEMYGTVKLSEREQNVVRIPTSAILQEEDSNYVLLDLGNRRYLRRKVKTGTSADGKTVVLEGLNAGDMIVTSGAFYLIDAQ